MKLSVIIAVYRNTEALGFVLDSLERQTYTNFEVIVAEDGDDDAMAKFVEQAREHYSFEIIHTTQEDKGVRKARSQNNAILQSHGDYLVFIDGDCVLYSTFLHGHASLAHKGCVLSGRRIDLPMKLTQKVKTKQVTPYEIESWYMSRFLYLAFDKSVKYEQGIYIAPESLLYTILLAKRERTTAILGCNFSVWKEDIVRLNGFDESYGESAVSDDVDWNWRFEAAGLKIHSCKNVANMMHLWHKAHDRGDASKYIQRMQENQKANKFICENGLNLH